jgi:membrane dipeptidase
MEHLLDHIDYVARLVRVVHVGIGSDFALETDDAFLEERKQKAAQVAFADKRNRYGMHLSEKGLIGIEGINHPKRVYDLSEGLIRRKYNDIDIQLILGSNFKRVLLLILSV